MNVEGCLEKKDVDSFVKLDYIDLYDYLPKEDLPKFIKELKKCVRRNKIAPFGAFRSREDIDKIDNFGRYYDGQAFTHILLVRFRKNEKLQQSCSDLSVSLRNLSATFLLVQYRVYITKEFNTKIAEVYKKTVFQVRSVPGNSASQMPVEPFQPVCRSRGYRYSSNYRQWRHLRQFPRHPRL